MQLLPPSHRMTRRPQSSLCRLKRQPLLSSLAECFWASGLEIGNPAAEAALEAAALLKGPETLIDVTDKLCVSIGGMPVSIHN